MNFIEIIGMIAAACTTFAFLPQAIMVIRTKNTRDISLQMYILLVFGVSLWFVYGVAKMLWPVIFANFITLIFSSIILYMKIKHK